MGNLQELGLKEDAGLDIPEDVPEQRGEFAPNPTPGWWKVRLPPDLSELWNVLEVNDPAGGSAKVQRVQIEFNADSAPLEVLEHPREERNYGVGAGIGGKVSNAERRRGKKDDKDAPLVSDMYYFLEELGHDMAALRAAIRLAPKKANITWAEAVNTHGGELLKVKVSWSARCDDKRVRYVYEVDEQTGEATGKTVEDPAGDFGCGKRYYLKDIPKDETGQYMDRFICPGCQVAAVRAWPQFDGFRRVPVEELGQ